MTKRFRKLVAKSGELLVQFGQKYDEKDLFYCWPDNDTHMIQDAVMLTYAFERLVIYTKDGRTLRQELEARGYDITTLKFSVMKKTNGRE